MLRLIVAILAFASPIIASNNDIFSTGFTTSNAVSKADFEKHFNTTKMVIRNTTLVPAIVGGEPADDNEFPWFGRTDIVFFNDFDAFGFTCGASLIHTDIAATAAHCIVDV